MAIVLSLFSDAEMMGASSVAAPAVPSVSAPCADASSPSGGILSEPAPPQVAEAIARLGADSQFVFTPCVECLYCGICDDDYCAMLLHPIDMPHAPSARGWLNYGL